MNDLAVVLSNVNCHDYCKKRYKKENELSE